MSESQHDPNTDPRTDNVIPFTNVPPSPTPPRAPKPPPMFNIPGTTKALCFILFAIHAALTLGTVLIHPQLTAIVVTFGGFIPGEWTGTAPFLWSTPLTPLTYGFLHGGWMHLGINLLMMASFGSGVERWLGNKRMLLVYFGSMVIAAATHMAFQPYSETIVIGASGGISGLFGAMMVGLLRNPNPGSDNSAFLQNVIIWIAFTAFFGFLGAPDGSSVAWIAHIGGFIGGIGLTLSLTRPAHPK